MQQKRQSATEPDYKVGKAWHWRAEGKEALSRSQRVPLVPLASGTHCKGYWRMRGSQSELRVTKKIHPQCHSAEAPARSNCQENFCWWLGECSAARDGGSRWALCQGDSENERGFAFRKPFQGIVGNLVVIPTGKRSSCIRSLPL